MRLFSKRTLIALSCASALGALSVAPSLAGVITPTDQTAVSAGSPIESVYHRYGWCHHRHHAYWRPWRTVWVYPSYYPYEGWGAWGGGGGGLFGLGIL